MVPYGRWDSRLRPARGFHAILSLTFMVTMRTGQIEPADARPWGMRGEPERALIADTAECVIGQNRTGLHGAAWFERGRQETQTGSGLADLD